MKLDAVAISKLKSYPKYLDDKVTQDSICSILKLNKIDNKEKYVNLVDTLIEMQHRSDQKNNSNYKIFENVFEALMWLTEGKDENLLKQASIFESAPVLTDQNQKVNVLITGSLYLVGLALKVLGFKTV
jgi:hypothetical protein